MNSSPELADEQLLGAHDLARAALREVTPESSIGEPAGYTVEADGVVSLRFTNRLAGYPGWFWTVSLARVADAEPTVLEVELLPGDDALLAPDWVPWAVRLAEYQAAQAALAEAAESAGEDADADDDFDDDLDDDDDDDDELHEDGSPILHAGDVDGVDIDDLDPEGDRADDSDDDDSDEDDSDEDLDDEESDDEDDSDEDDSDDEDSDEDLDDEDLTDGDDPADGEGGLADDDLDDDGLADDVDSPPSR